MPRPSAAVAFFTMTIVLALTCADASAASPAQRCAALKRKAAGLATKGFAGCDAKAVLRGVSVDLVCVAKVRTTFARLWARADRKGGCATSGDQTIVGDRIDAHEADLQTRLGPSSPPSRCSSLKFRDAGRQGACRLSCSAKAAKAGLSLNDAAIARCTSRCSAKLFAIFARAETRSDCHTTGDAAAIDSALGAFVDCITSLVGVAGSTPCGTSSSTTIAPGSTSTTSTTSSPAPTTTTMGGAPSTTTSTTTTSLPAVTQCCIPSSLGGAFCMPESPADCADDGGTDVGPGSCVPDPCSASSSTTSTPTTSTTSTSAPGMTQCCIPGSPAGAFVCVTESAASCTDDGGIDVGPGSCTPDPCPTSTSSTTAPTTTSTSSTTGTTTTLLACGGLVPACLGSCPPGEACTGANLLDPCVCTPVSSTTTSTTLLACGGLYPACLGSCPPGETCTGAVLLDPCTCVSMTTTTTSAGATTTSTTLLACGGLAPACLGSCEPGKTCTGAALTPCTCQ